MFGNVVLKTSKVLHGLRCRAILDSDPVRLRPAPLRVVSMVSRFDCRMYLVAIKSFYRQLPGGAITVIDDGSLTARQREALRHHLAGVEIVGIDGIATGRCPRGGCWERLLHILDRSAESYVIQLDADTLTTGPVPEVVAAALENRAFTLKGGANEAIHGLAAAAAQVAERDTRYMQIRAEQALPRLPADMGRFYVRGSAGFAGFARGGPGRDKAEAFSTMMQGMLGESWAEWGSEQITSNFLVANSPSGQALPWPRYCCFLPGVDADAATFLHFIGSSRFEGGVYARRSREVIAAILAEQRRAHTQSARRPGNPG